MEPTFLGKHRYEFIEQPDAEMYPDKNKLQSVASFFFMKFYALKNEKQSNFKMWPCCYLLSFCLVMAHGPQVTNNSSCCLKGYPSKYETGSSLFNFVIKCKLVVSE